MADLGLTYTVNPRHLEPQVSAPALKNQRPLHKKVELHLILEKGSGGSSLGEGSTPVHDAERRWEESWPWGPQPEPTELKCMKTPPAWRRPHLEATRTAFFTLTAPPYSCLGKRMRNLHLFFPCYGYNR